MKTQITCTGLNLYNFGTRISSTEMETVYTAKKEGLFYMFYGSDGNFMEKMLPSTFNMFYSMLISNKLSNPREEYPTSIRGK